MDKNRTYRRLTLLIWLLIGHNCLCLFAVTNVHAENCRSQINALDAHVRKLHFWQRAKHYVQEVVTSRGVRLFLRRMEKEETEGVPPKWHGFLAWRPQDPHQSVLRKAVRFVPQTLGQTFAGGPGYFFTPLSGFYRLLLQEPIAALSEKYGTQRMAPAFFLAMPAVLAPGLVTFYFLDAYYQEQVQEHINDEITRHTMEYERLIQNDFRFQKIKKAFTRGELSREQALREAYLLSIAYAQYYHAMEAVDATNDLGKIERKLLDHYLFVHLKDVVLNGVRHLGKEDGYLVPESAIGPLTAMQIRELFQNNHHRYLQYQIIAEMVNQTPLWDQIQRSPTLQVIVATMMSGPFSKQLLQMRDAGDLTNGQLQSYLQEDAYWQNKFKDWKTIGVIRLKKDKDGKYSGRPLTLADVRAEMLAEIKQQVVKKGLLF